LKAQSCDILFRGEYDRSYLVRNGDILIGMDGDFQPCRWEGGNALLNQRVCRLINFSSDADPYYIYQALKTPLQAIENSTHFTTVKHLSSFTVQDIRLLLPPLPEQRVIAHTLRTIQDAIQARRREAALERERKDALMQHLFTHGTRGEPTKQTEIGEMPESWRVVQFMDAVDIVQGQVNPTQDPFSKMLHVGPENIESGTGRLLLPLKTAEELKLISGKYLFSQAHVLYSKIRPYLKKASLPTFEGICSADMYPLQPRKGLLREFIFYFLLSEQFTAQVVASQDRTGIPKVNRNQLGAVPLPLPPLEEQHKIAITLSACDTKIEALEQETTLLDELFRALLEELMTGRFSAVPLVAEVAHE
jgi:type I restriction enzyme S subunit